MGCREGTDPADFGGGTAGDVSDPVSSQINVLDKTVVNNSSDPDDLVPDADGLIAAHVIVGVTNINFTQDITFAWATADGTGTAGGASPHYLGVVGGTGLIPAGFAQTILTVPLYRKNSSGTNFTGSKTFTITISGAVNATILDASATVTINYDQIDPNAKNPNFGSGLSIYPTNGAAGVGEGSPATFGVLLNPASGGTVTVQYATANGTATAPADYTSKSGTLTFNAGDTIKTISVPTVADATVEQPYETFVVNLSSPSGAGIVVSQATAYIVDASTSLPAAFTGWKDSDRVTYDEFSSGGGGGCKYKTACTGFASAAVISGLASAQGKGSWRFNARRLFTDAGCHACIAGDGSCNYSSGCGGFSGGCNPSRVPNWLDVNGHTAQRIDDNAVNLGTAATKWSCLERDITGDHQEIQVHTAVLSGTSKNDLIKNIKQAIYNNGAIYMASIFYSNGGVGNNGWNVCRGKDGHILRPFGGNSATGHAWALVGWDDSVLVPADADPVFGSLRGQHIGCFRIQSSHGCDWGEDGRGWIPYSVLQLPTAWTDNSPRFRYFKFTWVG